MIGEYDTSNIQKYFNEDSVHKIFENLKSNDSEWAKKHLKILNKMSPSALMISFNLCKLAKNKNLKEFFILENNVSMNLYDKNPNEFKEGVRTLLKVKNDKPKWNPPSIDFFKAQSDVDQYFVKNKSELNLDE